MKVQVNKTGAGIERLYLDFDSFFASAEQHFNPALRGRAVGVLPLDSPHTACIAISREAKARGVKFGAKIADARALIPDMIFVEARHDVYVRLHNRIVNVIEGCLPVGHVRSIDELVCHLLPSEARQGAALADRIKQALAAEFSSTLTCSIGMAPTELLAKIGAEMNKPNGFALLQKQDLPQRLNHLELTDLPGISKGIKARLHAAGVEDFQALWNLAPKQSAAIWGSIEGERFWSELHGHHVVRPQTAKRMFAHGRILPLDWRTPDKVRICARLLCLSAGRRLRRTEFRASKLSLGLRGGGTRDKSGRRKDSQRWQFEAQFLPARDDHTFLTALFTGLDQARAQVTFKPRSVSVTLHDLKTNATITGDLFGTYTDGMHQGFDQDRQIQWECISDIMDQLRADYGADVITLGPKDTVPGGYVGAKIAFGRIPDESDFSDLPIADEATKFCSV